LPAAAKKYTPPTTLRFPLPVRALPSIRAHRLQRFAMYAQKPSGPAAIPESFNKIRLYAGFFLELLFSTFALP